MTTVVRHYLLALFVSLILATLSLGWGGGEAKAETIHDVVSATWPAELVPVAEQIKYHEGGPYFNDGYCGWGIIYSTQAVYGSAYGLDPYQCSEMAYQIFLDVGWGAWTTYGWYDPAAAYTPVKYY